MCSGTLPGMRTRYTSFRRIHGAACLSNAIAGPVESTRKRGAGDSRVWRLFTRATTNRMQQHPKKMPSNNSAAVVHKTGEG